MAVTSGATIMTDAAGNILSVEDLDVHFPVGGGLFGGQTRMLRAVNNVNLTLAPGECLGLVGESGCGKSTLALTMLGLQAPTRGRVIIDRVEVTSKSRDRKSRARIAQMVFQDPYSSLNPRQSVFTTLETPLRLQGGLARSADPGRARFSSRCFDPRPDHQSSASAEGHAWPFLRDDQSRSRRS
jgi:peptide/nickel transport system ATP-binding protein